MTEFLIASLAVWRVSRFMRKETGPKRLGQIMRRFVCRYLRNRDGSIDGSLAELWDCNKCASFWLSVLAVVIWVSVTPDRWSPAIWFALPWALSASTYAWEYADEIAAIHAKENYQREKEFDAAQAKEL